MARADPQAGYWTGIFPGIAVVALGMAGAVAPLTTAILSSVDARHTGTASGLNSAIARTGGLIATALAGAVIAEAGARLTAAFHVAALAAAVLAVAAGATAWMTLDGKARAGS
jgi:predicted MFS family arabinose efflux permease